MRRLWLILFALAAGDAQAETAIPILTYHRFDPDRAAATTVVVTAVFEEQMAWLAANHYTVVPLRAAIDREGLPPGHVVAVTADDGFRSVYTQMFPIIRRDHLPVTLFLNPPMIGGGSAYLTWAQVEEMRASGLVDVEAHTQTHPNFNTERARLAPDAYHAFLTEQISGSRETLRRRLGLAADLLAWPYGIHDQELEAAAKAAGFVAAFALGSRAATAEDDRFAIPRFQVYNTDRGARFAAVAEGHPRGVGRR